MDALKQSIVSASLTFNHLNALFHKKVVTLNELLRSTKSQVDLVEKSIVELEGDREKASTSLESLSENLETLGKKFSMEQRVSNLLEIETRVEALTKRVSELKQMEESLDELREYSAQTAECITVLANDVNPCMATSVR